jgi:hypothetical protein
VEAEEEAAEEPTPRPEATPEPRETPEVESSPEAAQPSPPPSQ